MDVILYGISSCDTVRKAKKWLDNAGIEYRFHDFRKDGLESPLLETFVKELGWEALLNKRGTTFRQLPEEKKQDLDEAKALALMLDAPAMIKRPVLQHGTHYMVGFKAELYQQALTQGA
uniref:ArsC family reductase n=1 Tax=Thaumasiovibrio occultus TaxID=1891184 RepID=UPI000B35F487|nr:ArsC family reductase [Thaumasiovibrio occultus]